MTSESQGDSASETPAENVITVAIAEDQEMLRSAIVTLLELEPDIEVIAAFDDGSAVVEKVVEMCPDVTLLDVEMPVRGGLEIAEALRDAGSPTLVLMLTTFARPGYIRRAVEAGAHGYLIKDSPVSEIAAAIRRVVAGEMQISGDQLRAAMTTGRNPLTERECDVLRAAETHDTVPAIAGHLHLSVSTVGNYISAAIAKTNARNRVEAGRIARDNGWL